MRVGLLFDWTEERLRERCGLEWQLSSDSPLGMGVTARPERIRKAGMEKLVK